MLPNRCVRAGAMMLAMSLLAGCGGGGADPSSSAAAAPGVVANDPAPRLTSFLANGEGSIFTLDVRLDESGNVANAATGTHYQLQQSGASGCSMSSNPADPSIAACNVLAESRAFLFCGDTLSPHYTVALFRQSDVQVATHWELAGKTLTGIACGASGPRSTDYSFVISANGEAAMEYTGLSTWSYGAGSLDAMERTTTCTLTNVGFCQRLLIYKIRSGTATQYFLLVLWQMPSAGAQRAVNLYYLQV